MASSRSPTILPQSVQGSASESKPARACSIPIPYSGAELSAAFYKPGPVPPAASSLLDKKPRKQKASEKNRQHYITRSFLQQDDNCQESSDLRPLLGRIFDSSDRLSEFPAVHCEESAGLRYFLPNGRLADEWRYFLDIIPDRYKQMVPSEVLLAYDNERDFVSYSMKDWVQEAQVKAEIQEAEDNHASLFANHEACAKQSPYPQVLSMKRKRGLSEPERIGPLELGPRTKRFCATSISTSDDHHAPSSKLQVSQDHGAIGHTLPPPTPSSCIDPALFRFDVCQVTAPALSYKSPDTSTSSAGQASQTTSSVEGTAQVVVATPRDAQAIQTPALAPSAVALLKAAPVTSADGMQVQPAVSSRATNHGGAPVPAGTVEHSGRGNVSKAWSSERIRAFTDIQGHAIHELPQTATSPYGDELSRSHTPKSIDPRCCPFPTTIEENITYMHLAATLNREMCARVKKHWTAQQIVVYTYHALGLQNIGSIVRTKITKQFQKCAAVFEKANPGHVPTASLTNISMESGLNGAEKDTHDYYLHAMGENVVNHPVGAAAQMLTRVIQHVVDVSHDRNVRLSEAAQYAQTWGITVPLSERMNNNLDVADVPDLATLATARDDYRRKFGHLP